MTLQAPAAARGADTRRHKLVGDVHLILINPAGEVLFGQRYNTGYEDGAWHIPSGHLEAGESVLAALVREAREEVGIVIEGHDVEFAHIMHNSSSGAGRRSSSPSLAGRASPRTASPTSATNCAGSRSTRCLST
jgi:8-oxo-dGTP diphosphatase